MLKFQDLRRLLFLFVIGLLLALPMQGAAQVSTVFAPQASQDDGPDISEIIEQAAERGLGVIVIDPEGNVLSPGTQATTEDAADSDGSSLMRTQENANAFRNALFERVRQLPAAINEVLFILRASSPNGTLWAYFEALYMSLGLFFLGMVAERQIYGKRIARRFVVSRILENPKGYSEKMPFLVMRFLAGVIGILFSMMVAYAIGFAIFGEIEDTAMQYTVALINIGYFSVRLIAGLWRMILSPYLAQYRIPPLGDKDAVKLHIWLCVVVSAGVFQALLAEWIRELGLNAEVYVFIASLLGGVMMVLNMLLVLFNRKAVTQAILAGGTEDRATLPQRVLAGIWVPFALLYLIFGWAELVYDLVLGHEEGVPLIGAAYAILTTVFVVYGVINYLIERGFARARSIREVNTFAETDVDIEEAPDDTAEEIAAEMRPTRLTTFEGLAQRVAGVLAFVAGGYAFLEFWDPQSMSMGDSLPARTLDIVVVMFLGYIIYSAFRIWIDAKILEEQGDEAEAELGDEGGGSSASRLATLLPLFRNFVLIVIVVTVALIVLMEMGVNVGPLFAGAGIVGVAVGFGSQSLVRDIFSGAFFLFDDAFRKGEYIDVGGVKGTVESISVRSFQLRHHLGALHTIPFGEIQVLTNYSRDWVIMKLPLRVTYDTDVERVRKLIKKLGQELLNDPVIGKDFIQPLKSQGVIEMQDSAMIIRVKFMTKPGDQWLARKKVYEEIRALFEREGIRFAHREVTVRLADGDAENLNESQKEAVMAAAEASMEEHLMDGEERGGDDR